MNNDRPAPGGTEIARPAANGIPRLAEAMNVRVKRDECHDLVIQGKRGNIHEDGTGYSVAVLLGSARAWTAAKRKLAGFCELRQDCDWEGVLFMPAIPGPEALAALRGILKIHKVPQYSVEVLERKRQIARRARESIGKAIQKAG